MAQIIPVAPFDCVVFGATGDLTIRKLMPALYYRFRDGQIPPDARIIGAARSDLSDSAYRDRITQALHDHVPKADLAEATAAQFIEKLFYARLDGGSAEGWDGLKGLLAEQPERIRVFYMATSPDIYGAVCRNLKVNGLVTPASRIVLEKPIGHDLASAEAINNEVGQIFTESQTFRIDHYLGKETVQNLLALRFSNSIFERLWNSDMIDHVQITVAETVGVEGRAARHGAEPLVAITVSSRDGATGLA
jgi:glucose-6-phosphate 1-dehydrogenase